MKRRLCIILAFCVILTDRGITQYRYDFNENCRNAYTSIISLRFEEGRKLISAEKAAHPNNNIPYLLENYIYFLSVFIGEETAVFESYKSVLPELIDRLEEGDKTSPYYRYGLAQVYLQAAVARTKFKEYMSATLEINKAYRLLEKNKSEFPGFLANNINLGLLHTMIGTIPDSYNWAKKLVGIDGTIDQGVHEILTVLDASISNPEYSHFKAECLFYLSFIQINLMTNRDKTLDYIRIIEQDKENFNNPLAIYALSRIYMSTGMNDKAIEILVNRPTGSAYFPFYYLDYLTGLAKLCRLDDDANNYFFKFVINFKGINYIKDAYQKIAWNYLVHGNIPKYQEYIAKVPKYGSTIVDADKQAERESGNPKPPNVPLLRARLLFDGGYYEKALSELQNGNDLNYLTDPKDILEYNYRTGRIYHEWGKTKESIPYYEKTIELGSESTYYFAANSALQLGKIYETSGNYTKAVFYYTAAQSMKNEEYRNSINQKAKAGLNRVENRK